ncbi:MAG: alpha/beta hydrolase-fold protein [Planctomycetota bacterium]
MTTRARLWISAACLCGLGVFASLLAGCNAAVMRDSQEPQTPQVFRSRGVDMRFQLFLPRGYGKKPARRWPLILFLHGAGERGYDIELVKVHGPPKVAERAADFPFVVVSPQCPLGETWNNDRLQELLDHVLVTWDVDEQRVYLTGLSMGGYGAWSLAQECPERFAAVVPICGGGTPIQAWLYGDSAKGRALRGLPFWAFHGASDPVVDPSESLRMVEALRGIGCDVKYTVYPGVGHDSWVKAYDDPELYAWLLSHKRI